ncbi:unnamed protein product [Ectocarpus sp. 6 AP-2014]
MIIPYYVSFQHLNKHEHLKNLLDKQFHNAYTLHNLQYEEQKRFVQLYNHPKVPFLVHL